MAFFSIDRSFLSIYYILLCKNIILLVLFLLYPLFVILYILWALLFGAVFSESL